MNQLIRIFEIQNPNIRRNLQLNKFLFKHNFGPGPLRSVILSIFTCVHSSTDDKPVISYFFILTSCDLLVSYQATSL